ncbi:hypothetical protein PYCC9005_002036 [Savitreella phatthalungensis]
MSTSYTEKNAAPESQSLESQIKTLGDFIDGQKVGMLTTIRANSDDGYPVSRAMAVAARENNVDLIFHTHAESGKTQEIKEETSKVNVSLYKDSTGEWVSVSGDAELVTDREVVRKYYSVGLRAWLGDKGDGVHDGGPEDPRIGIIRVKSHTVTFAIQTSTQIGKIYGIAKGIVTGEVPQFQEIVELSSDRINKARALKV